MKNVLLSVLSFCVFLFGCSKSTTSSTTPLTPIASFTWQSSNLAAPSTVVFTNTSSNATNYSWTFGDGGTSSIKSPTHIYTTAGAFTVTLTSTGTGGTDTYSQTIIISNAATKVVIDTITVSNITTQPTYSNNTFVGILLIRYTGTSPFLYTSPHFTGVPAIPANTVNFSTGSNIYTITNITSSASYEIHLQKYGLTANTDLGSVIFTPSNYTSGASPYPRSVTLNNNGTVMTLSLNWL